VHLYTVNPDPLAALLPVTTQLLISEVEYLSRNMPTLQFIIVNPRIFMFWIFSDTHNPDDIKPPSMTVLAIKEESEVIASKLNKLIVLSLILIFSVYVPGYTKTVSPGDEAVTAV
jgi:hypothetical protein